MGLEHSYLTVDGPPFRPITDKCPAGHPASPALSSPAQGVYVQNPSARPNPPLPRAHLRRGALLCSLCPAAAIGRRRAGSSCDGGAPRAAQQSVRRRASCSIGTPSHCSRPRRLQIPLPSPPVSSPLIQPPLPSEPATSFRSNRSQASFPSPPQGTRASDRFS